MATKTKKTVKDTIKFDFKTLKTFEDACEKLSIDPTKLPDVSGVLEEFAKPIIAVYKLMIIYKAINNGWRPDWNDYGQYKYYPWLSGFRFRFFGFALPLYELGYGCRLSPLHRYI